MTHIEKNGKAGIEYSDISWNYFTGCRNREKGFCHVDACWAAKASLRMAGKFGYDPTDPFKPTLHPDKLNAPLAVPEPTRIAANFMGDISYLTDAKGDMEELVEVCRKTPRHRYYFLTKRPSPIFHIPDMPSNIWIGVSVTKQSEIEKIEWLMEDVDSVVKWVSFEPLADQIDLSSYFLHFPSFQWAVIGAQTRPNIQPQRIWTDILVSQLKENRIPIFTKPNLKLFKMKEFPDIGNYKEWM